jgi:hypothetical protein
MNRLPPPTAEDRAKALAAFREIMAEQKAAPVAMPITAPSFLEKVGNFAAAAAQHVAAGSPRCTDEQVAARHAICAGCEYFDGKLCTKCGCPVSRERTYMGKLSWADQSCPVGKWGPENPG